MAEQAASQGSGGFGGTAAFELSQSFPLAFTTKTLVSRGGGSKGGGLLSDLEI